MAWTQGRKQVSARRSCFEIVFGEGVGLRSALDQLMLRFADRALLAQLGPTTGLARLLVVLSLAQLLLDAGAFQKLFEPAKGQSDRFSVVNTHPQGHSVLLSADFPLRGGNQVSWSLKRHPGLDLQLAPMASRLLGKQHLQGCARRHGVFLAWESRGGKGKVKARGTSPGTARRSRGVFVPRLTPRALPLPYLRLEAHPSALPGL